MIDLTLERDRGHAPRKRPRSGHASRGPVSIDLTAAVSNPPHKQNSVQHLRKRSDALRQDQDAGQDLVITAEKGDVSQPPSSLADIPAAPHRDVHAIT